jgi:hypothetical protein
VREYNPTVIGWLLVSAIVFLQVGFSYYLSFQVFALMLILVLIFLSKPRIIIKKNYLFIFLFFTLFSIITALLAPEVISRGSSNILLTVMALVTYAFFILSLPNIYFRRLDIIFSVFHFASSMVIIILFLLLVATDLSFFPFFTRDFFLMQNIDLVTNYSDFELINNAIKSGNVQSVDLFYGETSFLGLVIFTCVTCYIFITRLSMFFDIKLFINVKYYKYVVVCAIFSLIYIKSFSAMMYAFIIIISLIKIKILRHISMASILSYLLLSGVIIMIFVDNYEYLLHRILTIQDSVSLYQRFGSIEDFNFNDYIFGLHDLSRMPESGFHNGFFYIIAISGVAGINYIFYILYLAYRQGELVKMHVVLILSLLAIIMQNGAIFSINKLVLISLILLPVSCARTAFAIKVSHDSTELNNSSNIIRGERL